MKKDHELDLDVITPSDYTILVKGLGHDFDAKEVEQYFTEYGREDGEKIEIVKSNVAYDIGDFTELFREKCDLEAKKAILDEYKHRKEEPPPIICCFCFTRAESASDELATSIENLDSQIKKYQEDRPAGMGEDL